MSNPVRMLIADGSSEDLKRERSLRHNIDRIYQTATQLGAEAEIMRLCELPFDLGRSAARESKYISDELMPYAMKLRDWADVLLCTTATQWIGDALWFKYFQDQILSPMEEGGLADGFENYGKVAIMSFICDDDGGASIASKMMHTLNHMGFDIPAWGSHYMNIKIPRGRTEDNWQRRPELIVPRALWLAEKTRDSPPFQHFVMLADSVILPVR